MTRKLSLKVTIVALLTLLAVPSSSQTQLTIYFTATGTANAISGNPAYVVTSYSAMATNNPPIQACFLATFDNTGATTISISGHPAKNLVKGVSTALSSGDILEGQLHCVTYSAANDNFQLKTPPSTGGGGGGGSGDVAGASNLTTATRVVLVDSSGTITEAPECTYASGAITCTGGFVSGDGTKSSGITLPELAANGSNYFSLYAQDSLAADVCYLWPAADSDPGDTLIDTGTTAATTEAVPKTCTILAWAKLKSPVKYPAAKCANGTAGPGMNLPATLAPSPVCITGTNILAGELEFPDSDGEYSIQDSIRLPPGSSGPINLNIKWRAAATSGDVVWQIAGICVGDAETIDPAFATAQTVTDTAKGTTLQVNDAQIASLTITSCAAGETYFFRFFRQRTHASDTITGVVKLLSLEFTF